MHENQGFCLCSLTLRHAGRRLVTACFGNTSTGSGQQARSSALKGSTQGSFSMKHKDGPNVSRESFLELALAGLFATGWPPASHLDFLSLGVFHLKWAWWGWRDGFVVKSTCSFSRGLGEAPLPIASAPGNLMFFSGNCKHQYTCDLL